MNKTIEEKTIVDPVLAEVRRIKEAIASENGYDVAAIIAAARRSQAAHPERIVSRMPTTGSEQNAAPNDEQRDKPAAS